MEWRPPYSSVSHTWHAVGPAGALCGSTVRLTGITNKAALMVRLDSFARCGRCELRLALLMECGCGCGRQFWPEDAYGCFATAECAERYDPVGVRHARGAVEHFRRNNVVRHP